MSSVYIANLSPSTTRESLDKFMAFCGSISNVELHEGGKAIVTFEKPSAASTALMLNGGTLDGSPIQVSSEAVEEDLPSGHAYETGHDDEHVPQEVKPRTAIVAEYLAHGYVLSEPIIQKALAFDQKHGISVKFQDFFSQILHEGKTRSAQIDAQTGISQKTSQAYAQADAKAGLTAKGQQVYHTGRKYYSKILGTEFGQQAQAFYTSTSNTIKSVHEEAQRIAADKKHAQAAASGVTPGATTATVPAAATTATAQPAATTGAGLSQPPTL